MAEAKLTTMICSKCEGSLFYDRDKKLWRCRYCGTYVTAAIKDPEIEGIARQVLIEVANGNLEKAREWLSECEKKDHTKVATMLSRISIAMEEVQTTSGSQRNTSMSDLRTYMHQYWSKYAELGPEETRLFNSFGEDSADAFAVLIYLFSCLKLEDHVKFCKEKMNVKEVRSAKMNARLLEIAIVRHDYAMIDQILDNKAHYDHADVLKLILERVPADGEEGAAIKAGYIGKTSSRESLEKIDPLYFVNYFEKSTDPFSVKMEVLKAVQNTDVVLDIKRVWQSLKQGLTDQDSTVEFLSVLYKKAVIDSDTKEILTDEMTREENSPEVLYHMLSFMSTNKIYTSLGSRVFLDFLERRDIPAEGKSSIIEMFTDYPIDNAVRSAVLKGYLCENSAGSADDRRRILATLLKFSGFVPTQALEQYVQTCTIDGPGKPAVITMILERGFKPSFSRDLLSNYMSDCPDDADTQEKVFHLLSEAGFQIDPALLKTYMSKQVSGEEGENQKMAKNEMLQRAMQNGTNVQADTLDKYLTGVRETAEFDAELVNTLKRSPYVIKPTTFCKYVLVIHDPAKIQNCRDFAAGLERSPADLSISVSYCGHKVDVNLLQAYLLASEEPYEVMGAVTGILINSGIRIRDDIKVDGTRMKFRRFLKDPKIRVSDVCMQICKENRVFQLF